MHKQNSQQIIFWLQNLTKNKQNFTKRQNLSDCSICYQQLKTPTRSQNCYHVFCQQCITRWARTNNTCPLCRHPIIYIQHIKNSHFWLNFPPQLKTTNFLADDARFWLIPALKDHYHEFSIPNSSNIGKKVVGSGEFGSNLLFSENNKYVKYPHSYLTSVFQSIPGSFNQLTHLSSNTIVYQDTYLSSVDLFQPYLCAARLTTEFLSFYHRQESESIQIAKNFLDMLPHYFSFSLSLNIKRFNWQFLFQFLLTHRRYVIQLYLDQQSYSTYCQFMQKNQKHIRWNKLIVHCKKLEIVEVINPQMRITYINGGNKMEDAIVFI